MATKELAILLLAKDLASKTIGKVSREIGTLGRTSAIARRGLGNLATNLARLGAVAAVGIGAAVKSGIDTLAELEDANASTAAALKASGLAARVSAKDIRAWSEEIETAVGAAVDDKEIQRAANTLIRFGNVSESNLRKAVEVATDLGVSMGGTETAAKQLAKALADPERGMTALRRAGVVLSKEDEKRIKQLVKLGKLEEAQALLLERLADKTEGAAKASAGPYQTALNKLADVTEDAKKALAEGFLPVIEKVADMLSRGLADPTTMQGIREFGRTLASGLDSLVEIARNLPWQQIGDSLKLAGAGAKTVLEAFTKLPPWVQTAVLTGWGLNKLSGGAVTGIVSELGKGLIKGVLGMTAAVVNLRAGTVVGPGGGPGGVPPVAAPPGGGSPTSGVVTPAIGAAVVLSKEQLFGGVASIVRDLGVVDPKRIDDLNTAVDEGFTRLQASIDAGSTGTSRGLDQVDASTDWIGKLTGEVKTAATVTATKVEAGTNATGTRLTALSAATTSGLSGVKSTQSASNGLLSSINQKNWSPTINVPVSVFSRVSVRDTTVQTNISARYGSVKVL